VVGKPAEGIDRGAPGAPRDPRARHDGLERHCRKLGHPVAFRYCRSVAEELPCAMVADCWYEIFDVALHLRACYSPEELARVFRPPRDKVNQILDILASIRGRPVKG